MKLALTLGMTTSMALAAAACGRRTEGVPAATASAASSAPAARIEPCSLLSAAEVGAILGKNIVSRGNGDGCEYGLDPSARERSLPDPMSALGHGGDFSKIAGAIAEQSQVTIGFVRDEMTEDAVRAIYARIGGTVRRAVQPEERGLGSVIRVGTEILGVGDWAFAANVAAVQMGPGFSSRGRILETRRGPWHVKVAAVVSPDPGADALDRTLATIARAAFEKLPS